MDSDKKKAHILPRALEFVHQVMARVVSTGDVVVDATVGNGHDTVFLAILVGDAGRVIGFDVQAEAIYQTEKRLEITNLAGRVILVQKGHERLRDYLRSHRIEMVQAVMFNLGYLPGGDKSHITRPTTTIPALRAALDALQPGGLISIVLYTGHEGGKAEAQAVETWASTLDQAEVQVIRYGFVNQRNNPPYALLIEKK